MKIGKYEISIFKAYGGGIRDPYAYNRFYFGHEDLIWAHLLWVGITIWIDQSENVEDRRAVRRCLLRLVRLDWLTCVPTTIGMQRIQQFRAGLERLLNFQMSPMNMDAQGKE